MVDLTIIIPIAGLAGVGTAAFLTWSVLRLPRGDAKMQAIEGAIQEGARAFMKRQYRTIAVIAAVVAVVFAVAIGVSKNDYVAGLRTAIAFALGSTLSAASGYIGMYISIRANSRTANMGLGSFGGALRTAIRGGAVSGLTIVAFSLLGVWGLYEGYNAWFGSSGAQNVVLSMVGFGFGASLVALFAQLGGGIYTKAADVGADLVGKVEAGIPEDDARNPAVIADLVGDNVGDCAGRGADLFESTAAENIGAMILGVALLPVFGVNGIFFPLVARSFGLIATIIGIFTVRAREDEEPMSALNRGYYVTMVVAVLLFAVAANSMLQGNGSLSSHSDTWLYLFLAGVVGIVTSLAFVYITQYYTEARYRPVREITKASETGPATNILAGFGVGLEATAIPIVAVAIAILASFKLGELALPPIPGVFAGGGFYGTAVATMGMLATAAYILAEDTFGPITDNAAGILEMSGKSGEARQRMDKLDAAGNTTKALTKGYAVGSAALAAFLLFTAYLDEVDILNGARPRPTVDLAQPAVFVGAMVGVMIVFLFSALAIRAVGRTAWEIIGDVRKQFKEKPGIMAGTEKPDYARSVDICTRAALRHMIAPGLLAVLGPTVVGLVLRPTGMAAEAVGALLMVGTIAGVVLALVFNTGGGAWDNAKKHIELSKGGKGTPLHKAAVVGDTVGDPFKDTAGPSLHILVKLLSTITLVLAALFV
ncbi:MAG TPA: sodium-translocating pyrophosphatase [Thermoplasmata archaeon]|jgi:K(+)-stimulated pyrophosphate-energized sodium pump|nr:sodium-translocating pyrophosphatase [Thermoplasmata archaeon]